MAYPNFHLNPEFQAVEYHDQPISGEASKIVMVNARKIGPAATRVMGMDAVDR